MYVKGKISVEVAPFRGTRSQVILQCNKYSTYGNVKAYYTICKTWKATQLQSSSKLTLVNTCTVAYNKL